MRPHPIPPKGGEKRESLSPSPLQGEGCQRMRTYLMQYETKLDVK